MAELPWILGEAVRRGASDIHLKVGCPPIFRIATKLVTLDHPPLSPADTEAIAVEPSACAGLPGPSWLCDSPVGRDYLARQGLMDRLDGATHVLWSTGGSLVPDVEYARFLARGRQLSGKAVSG